MEPIGDIDIETVIIEEEDVADVGINDAPHQGAAAVAEEKTRKAITNTGVVPASARHGDHGWGSSMDEKPKGEYIYIYHIVRVLSSWNLHNQNVFHT